MRRHGARRGRQRRQSSCPRALPARPSHAPEAAALQPLAPVAAHPGTTGGSPEARPGVFPPPVRGRVTSGSKVADEPRGNPSGWVGEGELSPYVECFWVQTKSECSPLRTARGSGLWRLPLEWERLCGGRTEEEGRDHAEMSRG